MRLGTRCVAIPSLSWAPPWQAVQSHGLWLHAAPRLHGGIFVLPTINNPLLYQPAVVAGAVAGCLVLGARRKNVE